MFPRFRLSIVLMILMSIVFIIPVFAGGWAVITLDELPTEVAAGKPVTIGFTVLQHGKTPMNDLDPTISVRLSKSDSFVVPAEREGDPGHYTATFIFPKAGEWEWSIQAFTMDQRMPNLNVAAAVSPLNQPLATPSLSTLWIIRALALGIGMIGLVVALRRNNRKALTLTGLCLVVGLGSFVTGSAIPGAEAQSRSSNEMANGSSISQAKLGQQLFVAKGCVTCHVNRKVQNDSDYWIIDMGAPDLSNFSASAEVLRLRLQDPTQVKSDTMMPNLNLSADEIEALIAFINSK